MVYVINTDGHYYEGPCAAEGAVHVPQRPTPCHVWTGSTWDLPPPSAEDQRKAAIDQAIESDSVITSLKAMTPAEYDTWWSANVTNAAQAISVLKRIARIAIRRLL